MFPSDCGCSSKRCSCDYYAGFPANHLQECWAKLVRSALLRVILRFGWAGSIPGLRNQGLRDFGTKGLRDSKNCLDDSLALPLAARTKTWRGWAPAAFRFYLCRSCAARCGRGRAQDSRSGDRRYNSANAGLLTGCMLVVCGPTLGCTRRGQGWGGFSLERAYSALPTVPFW